MDKIFGLIAVLASLVLVSRGMPTQRWPVVVAATLAVVLAVVLAEQYGYWPTSWRVR